MSWAPSVSKVRFNTSVETWTFSCTGAAAGASCAAPFGTLAASTGWLVAAATGTLASFVVVAAAVSAVCVAGGLPPNKEGCPLYTCQLFHNSKSEKVKIIHRMVRRISIAPVMKECGQNPGV